MVMSACSEEVPTSDSGQKLYHQIGETFSCDGYATGLPFEVTVQDMELESYDQHQSYIDENVVKPSEDMRVIVITFEVTNKGDDVFHFTDDELYPHNDVLPNFLDPRGFLLDIDLTYPENKQIQSQEDVLDLQLEPGASITLIGSVITIADSAYDGAFLWDFQSTIPEVIFTRSQTERKDQVGLYDLGDKIYIIDQENVELSIIFHNVAFLEDNDSMPSLEQNYENSRYLVLDVEVENSGEVDLLFQQAFPEVKVGKQTTFYQRNFIKKGEREPLKDVYLNPGDTPTDGLIQPGATIEGTMYYEIRMFMNDADMEADLDIYYPYRGFDKYRLYQQRLNHLLE